MRAKINEVAPAQKFIWLRSENGLCAEKILVIDERQLRSSQSSAIGLFKAYID